MIDLGAANDLTILFSTLHAASDFVVEEERERDCDAHSPIPNLDTNQTHSVSSF